MGRRIFNLLAAISLALFLAWWAFCIWSLPFRQSYWQLGTGYILRSDSLTIYLSHRNWPFRDVFSISYIHLLICLAILPAIWALIAISDNAKKERQIQKSGSSQPRSKCDSCGCESSLTAAFVYRQVSFRRSRTRCLCPACFKRRETRKAAIHTALFLMIGGAAFWAENYYLHKVSRVFPQDRILNYGLYFLFVYLLVIPHELGHAIAAWLVRWEVFRINFGIGPCWLRCSIAGIPIQFRLIPDRGSVSTLSLRQRDWRVCRLMTLAAGPLANLAIAILAIELAGGWKIFISDLFGSAWSTLALASGLQFVANIIPQTHLMQEGPVGSDGQQMMHLLFKPLPSEKARRLRYYMAKGFALFASDRAQEALEVFSAAHAEYPDQASIALGLTGALMMAGKVEEGRSLVCQLLKVHTTDSAVNAVLRNNLAWADLLLGSPTLLAEADESSAAAISLMPWDASIQSTRGTVLAILGKPDEAMQLLRKSMKGADRRSSRSSIFCAMAIVMHRQGPRKAAEEFFEKARRLYPKCELLSRAEEELSGRPIASAFASV